MDKLERYKWTVRDEPGVLRAISKLALAVDPSYQRAPNDAKIAALTRDWSWIACGALTVAKRPDGSLFVVDGQHRLLAAMRRSDIDELPCVVFRTKDAQEEASGFLDANTNRRAIGSFARYHALLMKGDEAAQLVKKLAEDAGRQISSKSGNSPNNIQCVGSLLRLAGAHPGKLRTIWPVIVEVCSGVSLHERIVEGLMYIEIRMPQGSSLADKPWRAMVLRAGHSGLLDGAAKAAALYARGGAKVWSQGMVEAINRGMRNRLEIDFRGEQ